MLNTLKLYHWNTNIYSRHKSTDELIGKLQSSIDSFVESYLGNFDKPKLKKLTLEIEDCQDNNVVIEIQKYIKYINKIYKQLPENTQLLNILDEIKNNLTTSLYLFKLN